MKVTLAGYNVDVLNDKIKTPETISAAYARISRSEKSLEELRKEAINDVEKARESNTNIVFNMGHSSIAEHAVFNFDIEDISRLAVEELESHRLISVTEKSQRYVKFENNFYFPEQLYKTIFGEEYIKYCNALFTLYGTIVEENSKNCENARYILPLSTYTQLGLTINARELEYVISCLFASELDECKELAQKLYDCAKKITPSLILHSNAIKIYPIKNLADRFSSVAEICVKDVNYKLVQYSKLDYTAFSNLDYHLNILKNLSFWDKLPRIYEFIDFTFSFKCSASAFAQLKRHRTTSILFERTTLDYVIPRSIQKYQSIVSEICETIPTRNGKFPLKYYKYCLRNQHTYNIVMKVNFRELVHIARLRLDSHAQWEIRNVIKGLCSLVETKYPWAAMFLCGKDKFEETKKYFLGKYFE